MDELRWLMPVRPGDTLRVTGEVQEQRPSKSKPGQGMARVLYTVLNQNDDAVMTFIGIHILRKRA